MEDLHFILEGQFIFMHRINTKEFSFLAFHTIKTSVSFMLEGRELGNTNVHHFQGMSLRKRNTVF
jgi:hypothetical protein